MKNYCEFIYYVTDTDSEICKFTKQICPHYFKTKEENCCDKRIKAINGEGELQTKEGKQ